MAKCIECGRRFERAKDESWKVRCYPCWRRAQDDAECVECGAYFAARELRDDKAALCRTCDIRSAIAFDRRLRAPVTATGAQAELPEHLRELLQLCHPDKHGGSPLANDVTAWLLRVRRELRA